MALKISAIICTYNRCKHLAEALRALVYQDMEPAKYEIIVVDNNSTDRTKELVHEFINKNKTHTIKYVMEKNIGLSTARNTGVFKAEAAIIAFIDDDAIADKGWLRNLADVYERYQDAACVGGKVDIIWPIKRPQWLLENFEIMFGKLDLGLQIKRLEFPLYPYGVNFSVRKSVFCKLGGFSASLGRTGRKLLSSEEREFCHRLSKFQEMVLYAPDAVVRHKIDLSRITRRHLLRQAYWQNVSNIIFEGMIIKFSRDALWKKCLAEAILELSIIKEIMADLIRWRYVKFLSVFTLSCSLGKLRQCAILFLKAGR